MLKKITSLATLVGVVAAAGFTAPSVSGAQQSAEAAPVKTALRRITETQYRHTIADVFGPEIGIEARFEPERREEGLLALGSAVLSLTSAGFEQYFALASSVSEQVMSGPRRDAIVGCTPASATAPDDACARSFIAKYGELLFRRPLAHSEIEARLAAAALGAEQGDDFYAGLKLALTILLAATDYMFRVEAAEPDPADPAQLRLDGYTKAARLSYLIWDSTPDAELLAAAKSGAIHSQAELEKQIARLLASPKFADGARAFFADMLQLDGFGNLIKDAAIYPKFNQSVAEAAREQMLMRTLDLLVAKQGDYRDLFTANETFLNRPLASVYNVPYPSKAAWTTVALPQDSGRSGILTDVGFLALHAHPGASSPTRRGIKVLEIFMCQPTPQPPANVDFSAVQDSAKGTVRGRLLDHMENEGCSGCHKRTDPVGLSLEHFDGLGQLRKTENGELIDVSVDMKDMQFEGAQGLGEYLRNEPRVPACLVRNVYSYGVGQKALGRDRAYLKAQTQAFIDNGYQFPELIMQVASSPEFFKVIAPKGASPARAAAVAQLP